MIAEFRDVVNRKIHGNPRKRNLPSNRYTRDDGARFGANILGYAQMLGRLGQVIYWAGCGVALICIAVAVAILVVEGRSNDGPWMAGAAFGSGTLSWLLGRAVLYVLAGR